jgi:outer membrane protein OmpA-like peptidoglycan-associated protein
MKLTCLTCALAIGLISGHTLAQDQAAPAPAAATGAVQQPAAGPAPLVIHFDTGSTRITTKDEEILDQASRAYNEGKPLVMVLTGSTDRVGAPKKNLALSQRRATAVLNKLLDRGIPADRFQVLAKGETELAVPTQEGVSEAENRRVEITWR